MIYKPREDSYLLNEYIKSLDLEGKELLEIGTGSGLIARTAKEKGAEVTASDINEEALDLLEDDIETVKSDLFGNLDGEYDYIVFNPPYLPGEPEESNMSGSETWYGGEKGVEVSKKFLDKCGDYLKENGEALIIASSLSDYEQLKSEFELEIKETEQLFFEELILLSYSLE